MKTWSKEELQKLYGDLKYMKSVASFLGKSVGATTCLLRRENVVIRPSNHFKNIIMSVENKVIPAEKICPSCFKTKTAKEFYKNKGASDGLSWRCRSCHIEWRKENKEELKEYRQDYNLENSNEIKDSRKTYAQSPKGRFGTYKHAAKQNKRSFELTLVDHFIPGAPNTYWQKPCTYCDDAIATVGLDRIDNDKGYTVDNVVPCCVDCNLTRQDRWTHEEMKIIGPAIAKIKKLRGKK